MYKSCSLSKIETPVATGDETLKVTETEIVMETIENISASDELRTCAHNTRILKKKRFKNFFLYY